MSVRICGDIVTPDEVLSGGMIVVGENGAIEAIDSRPTGACSYDASGRLIVPGFIDCHIHGGGGADFMDAAPDAVRTVARTHARFGTTTLLATTLTASNNDITRCLDAVKSVMDEPFNDEARIAGVHLEGPYLCAKRRGAQPLDHIRPPNWEEMQGWIDASGNIIKLITLAPESDGGLEFIQRTRDAGIVVSIGHTDATYAQTESAIAAGASHATHLFNAMPPLHHRAPGPIAALLEAGTAYLELIADGAHVHPALIRLVLRASGTERVLLITDAMSGAAMPDGIYALGGTPVAVQNGTAKFRDGTLAGSVLTMNRAFFNIQRFASIAPCVASRLTASNAAAQFGLSDWTGSLEVGKRADLVVIEPNSGNVEATMRDGIWLWRK